MQKINHLDEEHKIPKELFLEKSGANLYFLDRILQIVDSTVELVDSTVERRFLEIGCGTGILARSLAVASGMTGHGTEISSEAQAIASKRLNCKLVDGIELPYAGCFFSLVIAKDVLPMIVNRKKWFEEILRVLKWGGRFISYFPNDKDFIEKPLYAFIRGSETVSRDVYGLQDETIKGMVDAGFQIAVVERIYLGKIGFDFSYLDKHASGFFNNTEEERFHLTRLQDLNKARSGIAALDKFGVTAHYEWERTLVVAEKVCRSLKNDR